MTNSAYKRDKEEEGDSSPRILVVDDSPILRDWLCDVLSEEATVFTAENGDEALSLIDEVAPHLVLSDYEMPVMNGLELCKRLKNNPAHHRIPFLMLTSSATQEVTISALNCGADDFVVKGCDVEELQCRSRNLIKATLQEQKLEAALKELKEHAKQREADLNDARLFQESSIATHAVNGGISAQALYIPSEIVSGDFVFVKKFQGGIRILLVDAPGHGVQAGLRTMVVSTLLHKAITQKTPALVLSALNDSLISRYKVGGLHVAGLCLDVFKKEGEEDKIICDYSNAGLPEVQLIGNNTLSELYMRGPFLGLSAGYEYESQRSEHQGLTRILAMTDGILEEEINGKEFWEESWASCFQSLKNNIKDVFNDFPKKLASIKGYKQNDDITVVGVDF